MSACKNPPGGFYHYPNIQADWMKYIKSFTTPSDPNKLVLELLRQLLSKEVPLTDRNTLKINFLLNKVPIDTNWTNLWNAHLQTPTNETLKNDILNRFSNLLGNILNSPDYQLM